MGKITKKQFREKLLKNDPQLKEFSKNPRAVLEDKFKILITVQQSKDIKSIIDYVNNFGPSSGQDAAKLFNWEKWKRVIDAVVELIDAVVDLCKK
jgi:hypothetical protein